MDNGSLILDAAHINIARISVLKLSIFENKSDLALHQQLMDVSVGVQEQRRFQLVVKNLHTFVVKSKEWVEGGGVRAILAMSGF